MRWRRGIELAALGVLAVVLAGSAVVWLLHGADTVAAWTLPTRDLGNGGEAPPQPFVSFAFRLEVFFDDVGLLMLPLSVALLAALWPGERRRAFLMIAAFDAWLLLAAFQELWLRDHWMPARGVLFSVAQTLALASVAAAMAWRTRRAGALALSALLLLAARGLYASWAIDGFQGPLRPTGIGALVTLQACAYLVEAAAWGLMAAALVMALRAVPKADPSPSPAGSQPT